MIQIKNASKKQKCMQGFSVLFGSVVCSIQFLKVSQSKRVVIYSLTTSCYIEIHVIFYPEDC